MILPHSAATPWVWRVRARALHLVAATIVGVSAVAVVAALLAGSEGGALRLARGELHHLQGVDSAAAAQASAVDAQAQVLAQQAQMLTALQAQVQGLLASPPAQDSGRGTIAPLAATDRNLAQANAVLRGIAKDVPQLQKMVGALGQEMAAWSVAAEHTPSLWPVLGPITSPFGSRPTPFGGEGTQVHTGVDIGVPSGTHVQATAAGRVVAAGWNTIYGYEVRIDHGQGLQTLYGHNSQLLVRLGQDVAKGQVISLSGSTGASTGPHVHYEIDRYGTPVNPTPYLPGS